MNIGKCQGFTLIELMIVVGIIGILATIAIPAFKAYIRHTRLSEIPSIFNEMFKGAATYWHQERVAQGLGGAQQTHCLISGTATSVPNLGTIQPNQKTFAEFSGNATFRELGLKDQMVWGGYGWANHPSHDGTCHGDDLSVVQGVTTNFAAGGARREEAGRYDYLVFTMGINGDQFIRAPGIRKFENITVAQLVALDATLFAGN